MDLQRQVLIEIAAEHFDDALDLLLHAGVITAKEDDRLIRKKGALDKFMKGMKEEDREDLLDLVKDIEEL